MRNDQQKKYRTKSKDAIMTYLEMHREHSFSASQSDHHLPQSGQAHRERCGIEV